MKSDRKEKEDGKKMEKSVGRPLKVSDTSLKKQVCVFSLLLSEVCLHVYSQDCVPLHKSFGLGFTRS